MARYEVTGPDGRRFEVTAPEGTSEEDLFGYVQQTYYSQAPKAVSKEEPSGFLRQAADVPVGIAKGVTSGVRMLSDVFGADNPVSQALKGGEGYLNSLMSAQAKNDQQEIARILKDAEDKGVLDQVLAGVRAFATAPVDMLAQAAGTAIPVIAGGLAGSVLKIAPRVVGAGIGAGMGTGVVKGTIYEETKRALIDSGVSEDQAEARAQLAQSYGGQNLDQILMGTALGGLTAVTGIEKPLAGALARRILGKEAAEETGEAAAKKLAEEASKSGARRALETAGAEALPEFLQASQEQIAANLAQQREGLDVDTLRGAISAGTMEALAGAGLGAGVGAMTRPQAPEVAPPIPTPAAPFAPAPEAAAPIVEPEAAPLAPAVEAPAEPIPPAPEQPILQPLQPMPEQAVPPAIEPAPPIPIIEEPAPLPTVELPYRNENQKRLVGNIMGNYGFTPDQVAGFIEDERIRLGKDGKFDSKSLDQLRAIGELGIEAAPPAPEAARSFIEPSPPLPKTAEEEQRDLDITDLQKRLESMSKVTPQDSLYFFFKNNQLDPKEMLDVSPDKTFNFLRKKGGAFISDFVSTGQLNDWLPFEMRIYGTEDATELAEKEGPGTEYIKDLLRNREYLPYETKIEIEQLGKTLSDLEAEVLEGEEIEKVRDEIADIIEREGTADIESIIAGFPEARVSEPAAAPEQPFELAQETEQERAAREAELARTGEERELKAIADRERELFALTPETAEREMPATGDMFGARGLTEQPAPTKPAPLAEALKPTISSLTQAKTGQPFTYRGFRGAGKTAEEIYTGAKVPVAGPARYIAVSREDASMFGDQITEEPVTLDNPLVIKTDDQWRALTRKAGWEFPNPFMQDEKTVQRNTQALSKIVQDQGYDGLVIDPSQEGDAAKTLWNVFGMPQIVDYKGAAKSAAKAAKPLGAEEQKRLAIGVFATKLDVKVPSFRAQSPGGRSFITKPKQLSERQVKVLIKLAKDAVDLGLPPSLLYKINAAGVTGQDSGASIAAARGWLMLGKQWGGYTEAERLATLIHEIGHAVDFKNESARYNISRSPDWADSHAELKAWYDREPNNKNPLAYPFSPIYNKYIPDKRIESFPQAFALYFTSPVDLQKNAPSAYSAIESIVERINNESARAAGERAPETTGVEIRQARIGERPEVQPEAGKVSAGISGAQRVQDRRAKVEPIAPLFGRKKPAAPQRTTAGQNALDVVTGLGRHPELTPTIRDQINSVFQDIQQNPSLAKEAAKKAVVNFLDKIETKVFSTDAALNNAIRRMIQDTTMSNEEKIGKLLSISSNQAMHADALASLFIQYGNVRYNPELYKYEAVDNEFNFVNLSKELDIIASKYGLTKEEAERVGHTFFEARRLEGLSAANQTAKKKVFIHMTPEQIAAGLDLAKNIPELERIAEIWNGIRQNAANILVDSGLWSPEEADSLLSNIEYVPFYRDDQLEQGKGPKEFLRGLEVQAKEKKLKGSDMPVADIFDNMVRWTQYAVKRSVMNKLAQAKVNAAVEFGLATPVDEKNKGPNSVRVWEGGQAQFYDMQDPLFMEAFAGLESVSLPIWKFFAKMSNFLRQSVVLYPLFSVSQVPQDAFAAMFSSGLKTRYALTIPARAVKEFINTLRKSSKTHEELRRFGAVGVKDFTAAVAREDAEVSAGLKSTPGIFNKVKNVLEHISMSSDNAVRQAVYSASIDQGLTSAEAIEKAFAIINFRNKGGSPTIRMLGQVVPFFNAYLAAQHVAIKTISGVGISPSARSEALKTLAATTGAVMALSMMYAMLMDDDEDYINKPSVMRDRLFIIPGTGMSIPIRTDVFSMPKILTEHMYMLLTDQGMADGRKFRDSMKSALGNMIFGPTPVPQAIKPLVEVAVNYNFFQGRPLIGTFQKGLDIERQFNDSTSELAKLFGQTGLVSPIAADHVFRGMLGSLGGLILFTTNPILHSATDVPRPELSLREAMAALPGTSGFISRPFETGLKNDFYVLRDEVSKVVNTFNDIQKRSPSDVEDFLAKEDNVTRLGLQRAINKITRDLTKIRQQISFVTNLPESEMSASEKRTLINQLKQVEQDMLKSIDIKELRRMANL